MIGQILSHYRIEEKLGSGGMGVVYRAKDTKLDRDVAIKVLKEELATDPERLRRFEQEARAASALDHPNIITIHDVSEVDGVHYIVMQYVEGKTLRELVSKCPLPADKFLGLATQIAEGLAKAHSAGIIHRDLKPENVMVTVDGYVKILDFGLAKLLTQPTFSDSESPTITKEGTLAGVVMGTAAYMSPEQALGKQLDARTDVFSLGAVLYEMATGKRPFEGATPAALFDEILHKTPPSPSSLNPELPKFVDRIVHKALDKKPQSRYPSARELLEELGSLRAGHPLLQSKSERSIVVLPFDNISFDKENEYFADGLTEEIISDLSRVRSLRVISRTSAMRLKHTDKDMRTIGKELDVRYVLEGSVRKAGNNLRITAQLIDSETDAHLWSEKYTGTLDDVFDIQEKVSRSIVDALKIELSLEEKQRIGQRPIQDLRAYECYLKARQEIFRFKEDALDRALKLVQMGLDIAGDNTLLYATMGSIYWQYSNAGFKSEEECIPEIQNCAGKIFELEPQSHLGHRLLGIIAYKQGNPRAVVRHMKHVLESDPDDLDAAMYLGTVYLNAGKISSAWPLVNRHVANDPFNVVSYCISGFVHWCGGDFPGALDQFQKGRHLDSENPMLRLLCGMLLAADNRADEAISMLITLGNEHGAFGSFGHFFKCCLQGDHDSALQSMTGRLRETAIKDEGWSWWMADGYGLIDEKEESLSWLENAANRGFINYPYLSEYDPFLKNLRGDDRFAKLMERVKREWENFEV